MDITGYEGEQISGKKLAEKILYFMENTKGYTALEMLSIIKRELEEVRRGK